MRNLSGASLAATSLFISSALAAIDPIIIKGAKFFNKNSGEQFFLQGIAYQQDYTGTTAPTGGNNKYSDPLGNPEGCKRDIPYLQKLNINTIRVYAIDPSKDHDDCMNAMAEAGIYVVADLSAPVNGESIDRSDPEWNTELYARYANVVNIMAKYDNTLGFFAGNEVANAKNNTNSAPFVKAAVRDMKAYIQKQGYRDIGVGYATSDDPDVRVPLADFFNCGDQTNAIDFWGYNIYSWCGDSSYTESGYNQRVAQFKSYSVPSFFAEYGCITPPRLFTDTLALYGDQMTPVFSGGIMYEYFQAANDYGIVTVGSNSEVTTLGGYKTFSSQMQKINPTGVKMNEYNPTNQPQQCPPKNADFEAKATPLPPTPNQELCSCMYQAVECAPKDSTSESDYKKIFGYICGQDPKACEGLAHDSSDADYGAYGMCEAKQQLAWAMNAYYFSQGKKSTACSFGGKAELKKSVVNSTCKKLLVQAGSGGTGTVTSAPSVTGAGAAAASSASGSLAAGTVPKPETGLLPMALVTALGLVSGVAAILL